MQIAEARWIVWITLLVISILVALYVVMFFRNLAIGKNEGSTDYLSEFRKLKDEGKLDQEEFAKLKSAISNTAGSGTVTAETEKSIQAERDD